ncbi:MAG: serine/threonine protein kinase [Myxococcales bacterium]|nr:serine/threonine protein kinase [Myxococcales bacterium]
MEKNFATPERLGRYLLLQRVAVGGMGEIFYATTEDENGSTYPVALKRLHPENKDQPSFIQMFFNEGRIAGLLNHPHIVKSYEFAQEDGMLYMTMEWIDGPDLQHLMRLGQEQGQPISIRHAAEITWQALQALHYAHTLTLNGQPMHLTHRDISPHNLMIHRDGILKITDFGIARMVDHLSLTATGVIKGKIPYMAPEQTRTSKVTPQADLFAMGVIFWEMLCQRRLFFDANEMRCIDLVRYAQIPWPHQIRPEIPIALSELVVWSLQRDPEQRIPNAGLFGQYLEAIMQELPSEEPLRDYVQRVCAPEEGINSTQEIDDWQPPTLHQKTQVSTNPTRKL